MPQRENATRSIEGGTVNDLYILAFQGIMSEEGQMTDESFLYYARAEKKLLSQDKNQWTAILKTGKDLTFVMLANIDENGLDEALEVALTDANGKNKTEILEKLFVSLKGKIAPAAILPLCGQVDVPIIAKAEALDADPIQITVNLQRMVARLNIYVGKNGNGLTNKAFTMTKIYVYNPRQKGMVASAQLSPAGAATITKPTLPLAGAKDENLEIRYETPGSPLEYAFDTAGVTRVENEIYLFENGQPDQYPIEDTDETTDLGLLRPCLIIGGKYNNETTEKFWRVDFIDDTTLSPMNILRNHSYAVTITDVKEGTGSNTPDDAHKTARTTLSASILVWNEESMGGVSFGENNFLGLGKVSYTFGQGGTPYGTQTVSATPKLKWKGKLLDEDGNVPGWIKFMYVDEVTQQASLLDSISGVGMGVDSLETLNFYVEKYDKAEKRTAFMVFEAANLQKLTCTITQTNERLLDIIVMGDELMQFTDGGALMRELSVLVTPTVDTKLSWYYSKGSFEYVKGDITGEKKLTSSNQVVFGDQYAGTGISVAPLPPGQSPENLRGYLYLTLTDLRVPTKTVTKAIPMEQLEFWLKFKTESVLLPEDGSDLKVYVESNFPWKYEGYADKGAESEIKAGELIHSPTTGQTGTGAGDATSVLTLSPKTFNKILSEYKKMAIATFRFTDASGLAIEETAELELKRALHVENWNGKRYFRVRRSEEPLTHWEYKYNSKVGDEHVITMLEEQKDLSSMTPAGAWGDPPLFDSDTPTYWLVPNANICRDLAKMYPEEEIWGGYEYVPTEGMVNFSEVNKYQPVMNNLTFKDDEIKTHEIMELEREPVTGLDYTWLFFTSSTFEPLEFSVYGGNSPTVPIGDFNFDVSLFRGEENNKAFNHSIYYWGGILEQHLWYHKWTIANKSLYKDQERYNDWAMHRSGLSGSEAIEDDDFPEVRYRVRFHSNAFDETLKYYGFFIQEIKE